MKKLFVLFMMSLLVVAASAQKFSWPPRSFPMKVPFAVSEEVKYYWDVQRVLCTGRGNGGYKFRVLGTANHDFTASRSINFYYISTGNKTTVAGAYYFPKVKKGQQFSFEIVSACAGYTPTGFQGFYIHDEMLSIPKEERKTETIDNMQQVATDRAYDDSIRMVDSIAAVAAAEAEMAAERAARVVTAPKYPGGTNALYAFLRENMHKPQIAIETAGYGTTTVEFIVTRDGTVTGANYKRRCVERVDKEVLRLVNLLEGWTPATKGGQPCNAVVQISMSIFPSFKASAQFVRVVQ